MSTSTERKAAPYDAYAPQCALCGQFIDGHWWENESDGTSRKYVTCEPRRTHYGRVSSLPSGQVVRRLSR